MGLVSKKDFWRCFGISKIAPFTYIIAWGYGGRLLALFFRQVELILLYFTPQAVNRLGVFVRVFTLLLRKEVRWYLYGRHPNGLFSAGVLLSLFYSFNVSVLFCSDFSCSCH